MAKVELVDSDQVRDLAARVQEQTALVLALQAQLNAQSSIAAGRLRVNRPSKFNGARRQYAAAWLNSLETYFAASGITDDSSRLLQVPTFLEDGAQLWWMSVGPQITSWSVFQTAFNANYQPLDVQKKASHKIRTLRQTGSVEAYCELFRQERLLIDPKLYTEPLLTEIFIEGLKEDVQLRVAGNTYKSLEEAMAHAQKLDRIIWSVKTLATGRRTGGAPSFQTRIRTPGAAGVKVQLGAAAADRDDDMVDDIDDTQAINHVQSPPLTKLTAEEREQCRKKGLCFRCRKPGHMVNACPLRPKK
jgi:hypothetical protein